MKKHLSRVHPGFFSSRFSPSFTFFGVAQLQVMFEAMGILGMGRTWATMHAHLVTFWSLFLFGHNLDFWRFLSHTHMVRFSSKFGPEKHLANCVIGTHRWLNIQAIDDCECTVQRTQPDANSGRSLCRKKYALSGALLLFVASSISGKV